MKTRPLDIAEFLTSEDLITELKRRAIESGDETFIAEVNEDVARAQAMAKIAKNMSARSKKEYPAEECY